MGWGDLYNIRRPQTSFKSYHTSLDHVIHDFSYVLHQPTSIKAVFIWMYLRHKNKYFMHDMYLSSFGESDSVCNSRAMTAALCVKAHGFRQSWQTDQLSCEVVFVHFLKVATGMHVLKLWIFFFVVRYPFCQTFNSKQTGWSCTGVRVCVFLGGGWKRTDWQTL